MLLYKIFNPSVAPQMHELMMSMAHFFTKVRTPPAQQLLRERP